jgi:predicted ATPase
MQDQQLGISIGINTALMTVGEIQTQLHSEYTAYGADINLAKRFQEAAKSGQILVGAGTYRPTRLAFDFEALSPLSLKGFSQPVAAYAVQQVKARPEKVRGIEGLRARMIGREREFDEIKKAADNLISGRGSIVSVIGEGGLGKSRLALELKEYLKDKDVIWYEGRSISIGQTVSYCPFLDMLRTYLNLSDSDTESDIATKLKKFLTGLFPHRWEDILPFLGHLLSIKFGDELDNRLAYFTPEEIRHQTMMHLRDISIAISHRKPLLLILEDLHWSDDLSLDLVSLLMDEVAENPLMLLCIYRPETDHRCWQIGDMASRKCPERYTEIMLKNLSATQSRQLVESLLVIENLPEPTRDVILKKSEGNPFFIEELIRSLIETHLVYREDDIWKARREIKDIDVPDSIQSVLLSRVDRLEPGTRYVLQCASVIGSSFRYRLLDHLAQHEMDLKEHLSQLEERDLVYRERTTPELEYAFKHVFTQEATYQGILGRRREEFHSRVAGGIEDLYRERIEEFYEELAHHHRFGGNDEKAIEYIVKSGHKARRLYNNATAVDYYNDALELLSIHEVLDRNARYQEVYEGLGDVYRVTSELRGSYEMERRHS